MKTSILTIAIAAFFAACNSKPAEEIVSVKQSTTDTSDISEYRKWKEQQDLIGDKEAINESFETNAPVEEKAAPKVIYRNAPAKEVRVAQVSKPAVKKRTVASRSETSTAKSPGSSGGSGSNESTAGAGTGTGTDAGSASSEAPQEAKKEGWSKAAKGAVIGGATGAVAGAVISKDKKVKGAVIGAVVGAAGGYVLGRAKDKKDGRYFN